jgi:hypothetical protein
MSYFPIPDDAFEDHLPKSVGAYLVTALNWLWSWIAGNRASCTSGELHVYADGTSGDDSNDGLTEGKPKKTLQAVFALVPDIVKHNTSVHLRGSFSEPGSFNINNILNRGSWLVIDGGSDFTVVDDNGGSNYTATSSGTTSLTTTGAGWSVDEHQGYLVEIMSGPEEGTFRMVQGCTADTLTPVADFAGDPGVGAEYRIVRYATTITASSTTSVMGVCTGGSANTLIQRLTMAGTKTSIFPNRTEGCVVQACTITSSYANHLRASDTGYFTVGHGYTDPDTYAYNGTNPTGVGLQHTGSLKSYNSRFVRLAGLVSRGGVELSATGFAGFQGGSRSTYLDCRNSWLVGAASIALAQSTSGYATTKLSHGAGNGVTITGCSGVMLINDANISSCSAHGIEIVGSVVKLTSTAGTGNTGAGVYAHSNSTVHITDGSPPTLTGAVAEFSFDGTTPGGTWAGVDAGTPATDATEFSAVKEV